MCEYFSGLLPRDEVAGEETEQGLRQAAAEAGYAIRLADEIPEPLNGEILERIPAQVPSIPFMIATGPNDLCIEEGLSKELEYYVKKRIEDVRFFRLLHRVLKLTRAPRITVAFVEGASGGWFPLELRKITLRAFEEMMYEYYDRGDFDVCAVYVISG